MKKENWIWMPHAAHFICANSCRFHLATYVGGYIVSTVGDMHSDSKSREITNEVRREFGKKELGEDEPEKIGCDRLYETMVFKAKKRKGPWQCCPYECYDHANSQDFEDYNDPTEATKGHMKLCLKWSKKK